MLAAAICFLFLEASISQKAGVTSAKGSYQMSKDDADESRRALGHYNFMRIFETL